MLDFVMWITVLVCLLAVLLLGWALVALVRYLLYQAQR